MAAYCSYGEEASSCTVQTEYTYNLLSCAGLEADTFLWELENADAGVTILSGSTTSTVTVQSVGGAGGVGSAFYTYDLKLTTSNSENNCSATSTLTGLSHEHEETAALCIIDTFTEDSQSGVEDVGVAAVYEWSITSGCTCQVGLTDTWLWELENADAGVVITGSATGTTVTITSTGDAGTYDFDLKLTMSYSGTAGCETTHTESFTHTHTPIVSDPPVFSGTIEDIDGAVCTDTAGYDASVHFTSSLPITYSLADAPSWMSINSTTGVITVDIKLAGTTTGITVVGTNPDGSDSSNTFDSVIVADSFSGYVYDEFLENPDPNPPDFVLLEDHEPNDTGNCWRDLLQAWQVYKGKVGIYSSHLASPSGLTGVAKTHLTSIQSGYSDYTIEANVSWKYTSGASYGTPYIVVRLVDESNYYMVGVIAGTLYLRSVIGGVLSTVDSDLHGKGNPSTGLSNIITIVTNGANISATLGTGSVSTSSATQGQTETKIGMRADTNGITDTELGARFHYLWQKAT